MATITADQAKEALLHAMLSSKGDKKLLESLSKLADNPEELAKRLSSPDKPSNRLKKWYVAKDKGEPCEQGETSAKDGCIPESGESGAVREQGRRKLEEPLELYDEEGNFLPGITEQDVRESLELTEDVTEDELEGAVIALREQRESEKPKKRKVKLPKNVKIDIEEESIVKPILKRLKITKEDVALLVGALENTDLTIRGEYDSEFGMLDVIMQHDALKAWRRVISKDSHGKLYISNQEIALRKTGTGLGTTIFSNQVKSAAALGASYILCNAERGPKSNGYYTWPRLGYDANLEEIEDSSLVAELRKKFPKAKTLLDVMATEEGRDWWKKNGTTIETMKFDLIDGSRSRQVLKAYIEEKAKVKQVKKALSSDAVSSTNNHQNMGEEIDLNAEEEAALERAWEKLGKLWESKETTERHIERPTNRLKSYISYITKAACKVGQNPERDRCTKVEEEPKELKPKKVKPNKPNKVKPLAIKKPANRLPAAVPQVEVHPGVAHGSAVKVKPSKQRAFNGRDPLAVKTKLEKFETGRVGEAVALAYLKTIKGAKDAKPLNSGETNYPIDLIEDGKPTEIKCGLCSNGRSAQQWRLTFSKESAKEKEEYAKMTPAERTKYNSEKQARIRERKEAALLEVEEETGIKAEDLKPHTITLVVNPETRTSDIYEFEGWHDRIDWRGEAEKHYVGSVTYEMGE